jgi:hypothetical protein
MTHHADVAQHKGLGHTGPIVKQRQQKNRTRNLEKMDVQEETSGTTA